MMESERWMVCGYSLALCFVNVYLAGLAKRDRPKTRDSAERR